MDGPNIVKLKGLYHETPASLRGRPSRRSPIVTTAASRPRALARRGTIVAAALIAALGPLATPLAAQAEPADELEKIQQQIDESNTAYEDATKRVEELEGQIETNQQRIAEIEQQLPDVRDRAAESMRVLYRMQQTSGGIVELLLSSDDFYELLTTIQYLDVIQNHSNDAVEELVSLSTELSQTQSSLDIQLSQAEDERENAQQALDEAIDAREQLEAEMAAIAEAEELARQEALQAAILAQQEAQAQAQAQAQEQAGEQDAAESGGEAQDGESDGGTQSDNTFTNESGNQTPVEIPESPSAGPVDWNMDKETFVSSWASRIDAYLAGSPLAGQGRTFAEAAWDYGCDPRFSPAIAMVESSLGRYCFLPHNAWGWGSSSWGSWEEAIRSHVAGLASGYGGHLTLDGAKKYCPPNAGSWYLSVLANMERI